LETLIELGIDRVLTSGQASSALEGIERLGELVRQADGRIVVMPGCGVRATNVRQIIEQTGAREIHFSGSTVVDQPVEFWRTDVPMSAATTTGDLRRRVASVTELQAICAACRSVSVKR
jgi:copper homeostasis protein